VTVVVVIGLVLVAATAGGVLARWLAVGVFRSRVEALTVRLERLDQAGGPRRTERGDRARRLGRSRGGSSFHADRALMRLEELIDQRVANDSASLAAEARFVRALGAVPQGMVICDEHGTVVYRNESAAEFFSGRHSSLLVESAITELMADAVEGQSGSRTLDLFGPPRRRLVLTALPLDDGHRHAGALIVADDVSERQRLDAVRRDFVANISHELKTPVGALGLLAETLVDEDDAGVSRRLAERMLIEAERVGRTIDDLLELSRIEAEELPARERVAVDLAMAEATDRATPGAQLAGIAIDVREPDADLAVLGDRRQLVSALYNLVENGVKYSDKGATVELSAERVGDCVEVSVADHGIGIPARDLQRIFERFYRVDRARSRETGGTGLGLAIVRHVVANHAGDVRVTSHEGEGSTFILRLPCAPSSSTVPSSAVPSSKVPSLGREA